MKFEDPFEQAFTVEVPQGWTIRGGLFRLGYSDYRPMIDLVSPDGTINIRSGDVAVPTYFLPTPTHPREGEVTDLGAQAQGIYAKYRTGKDYAGLYALDAFQNRLQNTNARTSGSSPARQERSQRRARIPAKFQRRNRLSLRFQAENRATPTSTPAQFFPQISGK